jgi:hypothetical protein
MPCGHRGLRRVSGFSNATGGFSRADEYAEFTEFLEFLGDQKDRALESLLSKIIGPAAAKGRKQALVAL